MKTLLTVSILGVCLATPSIGMAYRFEYTIEFKSSGKKAGTFSSDRSPGQMAQALALSKYRARVHNAGPAYNGWHVSVGSGYGSRLKRSKPPLSTKEQE